MPVVRVMGVLLMAFAALMLVPLSVSLALGDTASPAYPPAIAITATAGLLAWLVARRHTQELRRRDGILLVSCCWMGLPLFASLPLLLFFQDAGAPISFTDGYFEAMSGLTTTGATVLVGLDDLPPSINVWRCFLQWLGGMGILVLAVAILPLLGVGGSQLFQAESTGPLKDTKLTPRIAETAKGLWTVYCGISVACALAYWAAGMSGLDAVIHMFSTMSLGGLSSHDASFGYFQSAAIEWVAVPFMLIASCNFALYFSAVSRRSAGPIWSDPELRGTVTVMVGSSLVVAALLIVKGTYADPATALRSAFFNVVSIASTTGYSTTDYTLWPVFAPILMLLLSGLATSAGSTGAGIKMVRLIIVFKQARREMTRFLHPNVVNTIVLGGKTVSAATISAVLAFLLVYGVTLVGLTMLLLLSDLPFDTAFSAVVASLNNMGPGLNEIGPAGNFKGLSDYQKWICVFAMMVGRLEMLSFLVLLTPSFWRR